MHIQWPELFREMSYNAFWIKHLERAQSMFRKTLLSKISGQTHWLSLCRPSGSNQHQKSFKHTTPTKSPHATKGENLLSITQSYTSTTFGKKSTLFCLLWLLSTVGILHLFLPLWQPEGHLWFLQPKVRPQTWSQGGQFPEQHCWNKIHNCKLWYFLYKFTLFHSLSPFPCIIKFYSFSLVIFYQ